MAVEGFDITRNRPDRLADRLRLKDLELRGIDTSGAVPWDRLTLAEQTRWRAMADVAIAERG